MKKISIVFVVLLMVLVPIALLLTNVQLIAYNRGYYRDEYEKYNIPEQIGMDMDNLMDSTEKLLLYLKDERKDLDFEASFNNGDEEFFSQRDKGHMVDVKELFIKGRMIRDVSLSCIVILLFILFWKKPVKSRLRKLAAYGIVISAAGIVPVIILAILMNIDFYKYFTVFHEVFFNNDLWLLDPVKDRLINIFPQDLFTDMAFSISYLYIGEMAAIMIGSMLILRYARKDPN